MSAPHRRRRSTGCNSACSPSMCDCQDPLRQRLREPEDSIISLIFVNVRGRLRRQAEQGSALSVTSQRLTPAITAVFDAPHPGPQGLMSTVPVASVDEKNLPDTITRSPSTTRNTSSLMTAGGDSMTISELHEMLTTL